MRLFILAPEIIFKARVNAASFAYPLDSVAFDGVTLGTHSVINMGETILFGSTEGADDLGRQRVRLFPTSNTLYFGRSSQGTRDGECDLSDNCYISILRDHRVWSKTPHIADDGTIYKDSSIAYTDENEVPPPVANAGPGFCGTIDAGTGLITVTFSAADSFVTADGAAIASYLWNVGDGTITVGTSASSTITATFPAGFRWIQLRVADDNANYHDTFVPVFARDPDDDDSISSFMIESHRITQTGQELSLRVRESIPASTYVDGTLVMLWEDEASGPTDRDHMVFIGWIQDERAAIEAQATGTLKDVILNCVDVAGRLKALPGFPTILENKATPAKWTEYLAPNMDTYMHHILQWHSTALDVADWTWSGTGSTYAFKILSSDGQSLFDQVNRRAGALIPPYMLTTNTKGQMAVLPDPMLQPVADRTSTVQATLDAGDYSDIDYDYTRPPRVHWLRANSIIASGSAVSTAFAIAPGTAPGQGENAVDSGEHLCVNQAALNAYAGNLYARLNARQGRFRVVLAAGDRQGIEPAALEWVRLTIPSTVAAQRGLTFTNERFLCEQIDARYQSTRTALIKTYTLTLERETSGTAATTVTVPAATPVDTGDWNTPPAAEPAFDYGLDGGNQLAAIERTGNIYTTNNFLAATPTWVQNTSAASAVGGVTVHGFVVDPFSPGYRGTGTEIRGYVISNTRVYRLNDIFGTPSYTSLYVFNESIATALETGAIAASFGRFFPDEADNPWIMAVQHHVNAGSGQNGVYLVYSLDAGATWSSEIRPSTFVQTVGLNQGVVRPAVYLSPKTPGLAYVGSFSATGTTATGAMYRSTDWGATWSLVTDLDIDQGDGLGHCYHVPWPTNANEDVVYYGYRDRISAQFKYRLHRTQGGVSTDISPLDGGKYFGPLRNTFGVRTFDNDRRYVLLAGIANDSDNVEPGGAGTDAVAAVFFSEDYGDTWTRLTSVVACGGNDSFAYQCAFGASTPDIMYIWGNDGYLAYSSNRGVSFTAKEPPGATDILMGICGGPSA